MDAMGGTVPGTAQDIGRVTVGLAVKKGEPHPDISTPAQAGGGAEGRRHR